jgi:hypothetical protein
VSAHLKITVSVGTRHTEAALELLEVRDGLEEIIAG